MRDFSGENTKRGIGKKLIEWTRYWASPHTLKCEKCEKALKLYRKPKPDCTKCPAYNLVLLPENVPPWQLHAIVCGQLTAAGGLDFNAMKFVFDLYLNGVSTEDRQEIFEKVLYIHQAARNLD